jgi:hypothetical protein
MFGSRELGQLTDDQREQTHPLDQVRALEAHNLPFRRHGDVESSFGHGDNIPSYIVLAITLAWESTI